VSEIQEGEMDSKEYIKTPDFKTGTEEQENSAGSGGQRRCSSVC